MLVAKADADGVRTAVGDERIVCGQAVEDGRRIFGDFCGSEAEAHGDSRVDLEAGRWAADGVLDSILDIDYARDLFNRTANAGAELSEEHLIFCEDLDLDGFRCIREIADHVLENLGKVDVQFGFCLVNLMPHIIDNFVDAAAAL